MSKEGPRDSSAAARSSCVPGRAATKGLPVIVEQKIQKFIEAQLASYRANPLMTEQVFFDQSQTGWPSLTGVNVFGDQEKAWLLDEFAGGILRWAGAAFPILSNTAQQLVVTGDTSAVDNIDGLPYQLVPPSVAGLTELLQNEKFAISTSFAQVPTVMPCITIRLEKEEQADTYIGESLEHYVVDGVEFDCRSHAIQGHYLLSIWAVNREAVLWIYAWLHNAILKSIGQMNTWGLYDIGLSGSDLDPQLQYLAERVYARHLLLTATRMERAVALRPVEWVERVCVKVCAQYAQFHLTVPALE